MFLQVILISIFHLLNFQNDNNRIKWSPDVKLSWENFKGIPDTNGNEDAAVKTRIEVNVVSQKNMIELDIPCYFEINKSWSSTSDSIVLIHEQAHFDIAEVAARNLRKIVSEYKFTKDSKVKEVINELYHKNIQFLVSYQTKYDEETGHSRKVNNQKAWNLRVKEMLDNFEKYKNSKFIVKIQ